jgi:hypothetical protein
MFLTTPDRTFRSLSLAALLAAASLLEQPRWLDESS